LVYRVEIATLKSTGTALVRVVALVVGTAAADTINLTAVTAAVQVTGLAARVQVAHPEAANDTLIVNGLAGVDSFSLGAGVTSAIGVVLNQ
jgi:hypothetical protein